MLVLTRKASEKIIIGESITVTLLAISGHAVRVGIEAPSGVRILRAELGDWKHGSTAGVDPLESKIASGS